MHIDPHTLTEDERLDLIARAVELAFTDPDPYIRDMLAPHLLYLKWRRLSILQGGKE